MDPPPHFRHNQRYDSVLPSHNFIPHQIPPPINRPHNLLRPPISHMFTFSTPHNPVVERTNQFRIDQPPEPYFNRYPPPPPPPPPLRDYIPARRVSDYPEPNHVYRENFPQRECSDDFVRHRNSHSCAREFRSRVSDIRSYERYRDTYHSDRGLYNERGSERKWDYGVSNGVSLHSENREHGYLEGVNCFGRYGNERRGDCGVSTSHELYNERNGYRSRDYGIKNGVPLQLENRGQRNLGRFSGRFVRGSSEAEFVGSNKKARVERKSDLRKIHSRKAFIRNSGGKNVLKESNSESFVLKEEKGRELLEARLEENSMEVSVSFKSNALVTKTILVPSIPAADSDMDLLPTNSMAGSPLANSSNNETKTILVPSIQAADSDMDLSPTNSMAGSPFTNCNNETDDVIEILVENAVMDEPLEEMNLPSLDNDGSGKTLIEMSPEADFLTLSEHTVSVKVDINGDSNEPSGSNLKRKRSSLTTSFLNMADDLTTVDANYARTVGSNEVIEYNGGTYTDNDDNTSHGESLGFNQHADNVDILVNKRANVLNLEKSSIKSSDRFINMDTDRVDGISEQSFPVTMIPEVQEDKNLLEFHKLSTALDPETMIPEVQEDKNWVEFQKLSTALEPESASLTKPESVNIYDMGSTEVILKEFFPSNPNLEEMRTLEGASVADFSNVNLSLATSSNFLSENKGAISEMDVSCRDSMNGNDGANFSDKNGVVERSPEIKKRKASVLVSDEENSSEEGFTLHEGPSGDEHSSHYEADSSIFGDGNGANSCDEPIASVSDRSSRESSPEDLLSSSDFGYSRYPKASSPSQLKNEILCGKSRTSYIKPVSAYPRTFSLRKPIEKTAADNLQTNLAIPPSPPQGSTWNLVPKFNLVHGKSALREDHPPLNISASRKFPSTQITKSRTWCRSGDSSVAVTGPKLQSSSLPPKKFPSSYVRKGNSLVRKPPQPEVTPPSFHAANPLVYRLNPCLDNMNKKTQAFDTKIDGPDPSLNHSISKSEESLPVKNSASNSKKIMYVKPRSNQLVASSTSIHPPVPDNSHSSLFDGYFKSRKNQLIRASVENHGKNEDTTASVSENPPAPDNSRSLLSDRYFKRRKNQLIRASLENCGEKEDKMVDGVNSHTSVVPRSNKRLSGKGFAKTYRSSKLPFVWKLHDAQLPGKVSNSLGTQRVWPYLLPWKRSTYRRNILHSLDSNPKNNSSSMISQKLLLSSKRSALYKRSTRGYSLRISKVLSVDGASLKWSKSIDRKSKKANKEATQAVVAAEKRKKEEKGTLPILSKTRSRVPRKWVLSVKQRKGERIFRVGSERYKMDSTRRTLQRITDDEPSPSDALQSEKNVKRSYVPRRLLIGNDEYVRIGNGNQLVRDPKRRTRVLASEKVRWSLRTARLRLARKRKYCQFFTRFGKCNKEDGKCNYIHDPSKIVVCTKFLSGSCSNPECKLTHKVIPERMQDCSYFLKGSCSKENCPYRHVNLNPDSSICEKFLRGYCPDGNECPKKHTYVCPAFEATGTCPEVSTCKLHHPKKKTEKICQTEQKTLRGRYFDGGIICVDEYSSLDRTCAKGDDNIVREEGKFPDFISLDVSDEEKEEENALT